MRYGYGICLALALSQAVSCGTSQKTDRSSMKSDSRGGDENHVELKEDAEVPDIPVSRSDHKSTKGTQASVVQPKSEASPGSPLDLQNAIESGSESQVLGLAAKLLARDPNDVKTLNSVGVFYYRSGKISMAKLFFQRAKDVDKSNATILNNMGLVYLREGHMDLAVDQFAKAVAVESRNVAACANLGSIYLKYGKYQNALDLLKRAYDSRSDESLANNFGLALRATNNLEESEKVLARIVEKSGNPIVVLNYAEVLIETKKDPPKAKAMLNKVKVLTTDPVILKEVETLMKKVGA